MALVTELQAQALDKSTSVVELLRKAFVVATKLRLDSFAAWCESELDGFQKFEDIPSYREVVGTLCAWNHIYQRYDQVQYKDPKMEEMVSRTKLPSAFSELEEYARKGKGQLHVGLAPEQQAMLQKGMNYRAPLSLRLDVVVCARIVEAVRTAILKWALQLERDGIVGEGMTFSSGEKKVAAEKSSSLSIGTYIQTMHNSPLQINPAQSSQTTIYENVDVEAVSKLVADLSQALAQAKGEGESLRELRAEVQTLRSLLDAPKTKASWIVESLQSIKRVCEGAAGALVANGIQASQYAAAIGALLGIK